MWAKYVRSTNLILMGDMTAAEQLTRSALAQAHDVSGPNLHAVGVCYLAGLLNYRLAFVEAIDACDAAMADAPQVGYYFNLQFYRAWALLAGGHVNDLALSNDSTATIASGT